MNTITSQLRSLSFVGLVDWIKGALAGEFELPRLNADEPPAVSLARLTPELDGVLQVNFEKACKRLALEFAGKPRWSDSGYERQLLSLLGALRLAEASIPLEKLAKAFPTHLKVEARQRVLHAIHDIGRRHDAGFWQMIGRQRPEDFGGIALSALLRFGHKAEALDLLITFPNRTDLAGAAVTMLQYAFRRLVPEEQSEFLTSADSHRTRCKPEIREALDKWLDARGFHRKKARSPIADSLRRLVTFEPCSPKLFERELVHS